MYHISPTTGNPNKCSAKEGNCPFGAEQEHYASKAEARAAFEEKQENSVPTTASKPVAATSPVKVDEGGPKVWAEAGGRHIFQAEVAELVNIGVGNDYDWSVARLHDGSFVNGKSESPLEERTEDGEAAEKLRRELIEKAGNSSPILRVTNGDFPLDEARDYLRTNPKSSVKRVAEAAFASTFALTDQDLKDQVYAAAEERGGGVNGNTLNEYIDYADLVETVRKPSEAVSVVEPRTNEGKAVANAKNPLSQAFYTFRGKSDIDPVVARDVLEQTFPVSVTGLSEESQKKAFSIAQARADNWGSFVEEYRTAVEIAAMAKSAPKRESAARLPRNGFEALKVVDTKEKALQFMKDAELYSEGRGENVQATVNEITEELRYSDEYQDILWK
jgi:hypothetical protein